LIVCVGEATKAVPYLVSETKTYQTTIQLGAETQTDDAAGDILFERPWAHITESAVREALPTFIGDVQQLPPRVSALKVNGKRMHKRVRDGEDVDSLLKPRDVQCYEIKLQAFTPPKLAFELTVGKGYYIRSFARDLGQALASAAHVSTLRRTQIGIHSTEKAHAISDDESDLLPHLLPVSSALSHLPIIRTTHKASQRLRHGQRIPLGDGISSDAHLQPHTPLLILEPDGSALAVGELSSEMVLRVNRVFAPIDDA
jgi:tRNA pseudouridine55 synthase